jgi:DNA-binding response OmpR family regulator
MATILLIDDDDQDRKLVKIILEDAGYRFVTVDSAQHGLRLLQDEEVDLILVDIFMPDMDGLELIPILRKTRPASKIIAITAGSGERNYLYIAKHLGAHDTLMKPFTRHELLDVVSAQLK